MHLVSQHAPQSVGSHMPGSHVGVDADAESALGSVESQKQAEGDPTQAALPSKALPVLSDASRDKVMELIWANFEVSICTTQLISMHNLLCAYSLPN